MEYAQLSVQINTIILIKQLIVANLAWKDAVFVLSLISVSSVRQTIFWIVMEVSVFVRLHHYKNIVIKKGIIKILKTSSANNVFLCVNLVRVKLNVIDASLDLAWNQVFVSKNVLIPLIYNNSLTKQQFNAKQYIVKYQDLFKSKQLIRFY